MFESMTVQVRAGLGEGRLLAAVQALADRHEVLRAKGIVASRLAVDAASARSAAKGVVAAGTGGAALRVVWLDAGAESGRLVLVARPEVSVEVPWRVLLPELVSAWRGRELTAGA